MDRSRAAAGCSACVALQAGAVANHREVLAFGAAIARIALHNGFHPAISLDLLGGVCAFGFRRRSFCRGLLLRDVVGLRDGGARGCRGEEHERSERGGGEGEEAWPHGEEGITAERGRSDRQRSSSTPPVDDQNRELPKSLPESEPAADPLDAPVPLDDPRPLPLDDQSGWQHNF